MIQKRFVRVTTFWHPQAHTETLFNTLTILKLTDVIEIQILNFAYSWFHSLLSPVFNNYFQCTSSIHSNSTRQSTNDNLYLKHTNTNQYDLRSLRSRSSRLWNSLDKSSKNISSLWAFKNHIKSLKLNSYNN